MLANKLRLHSRHAKGPEHYAPDLAFHGGRYWFRTSGLVNVSHALYP